MQNIRLIDSHCHLDFDVFDHDRSQVLQRAQDNNVTDIIIPGTRHHYWQRITRLTDKHQHLHACYGLHPYWADTHDKQDITKLDETIARNQPVALGECGLDFRTQQVDKKTQLFFFDAQLTVAEQHRLPVVIHSVRATEKVIQSIRKFKNLKGMIHSFSGSLEQAKRLIDMNFYISISGSVTYANAKTMKEVVKAIPLTSLLLETDAPDQADAKNHGNRNEPAYLVNTLSTIAQLREETLTDIARQTSLNAKDLFAI